VAPTAQNPSRFRRPSREIRSRQIYPPGSNRTTAPKDEPAAVRNRHQIASPPRRDINAEKMSQSETDEQLLSSSAPLSTLMRTSIQPISN
jgi:hypothetical protein